jgi:histidine ammonia-lyase
VLGPLADAVAALRDETNACIDAAYENPLYVDGQVWHHGAFHLTGLALHLDTVRLALAQWLATSVARLAALHDPEITGLTRFLATGPKGASGLMVVEYTAASALRAAQQLADPVSRASVTISLGTEEHTSYAWTGALACAEMVAPAATVVGAELLAAVQALQLKGVTPNGPLGQLCRATPNWGAGDADRVLVDDLEAAAALVLR